MSGLDMLDILFTAWAFFFQIVLTLYFALRKWRFETAVRYGSFVYALGLPAAMVSFVLLVGGKPIALWLGGFLAFAWSLLGYYADYVKSIPWRSPIYWPIFVPYVTLFLAMNMFYWWPLALLARLFWFAYTPLFILSMWLNVSSHKSTKHSGNSQQSSRI